MSDFDRGKWGENGVIVTIYEEKSHRNINEKITREGKSKLKCNYYNQRANLLAYAHNLRQDLILTPSSPNPKRKRGFWGSWRIFGGNKCAVRRYPRRGKWTQVSKILRRVLKELSSTWKCKATNANS